MSVAHSVNLLRELGPALARPFADTIRSKRVANLRELRIQHHGGPYRVLYAFNPRRAAILLIGGNKTGVKRWYEMFVPVAEELYARHLKELEEEGEDGQEIQ